MYPYCNKCLWIDNQPRLATKQEDVWHCRVHGSLRDRDICPGEVARIPKGPDSYDKVIQVISPVTGLPEIVEVLEANLPAVTDIPLSLRFTRLIPNEFPKLGPGESHA